MSWQINNKYRLCFNIRRLITSAEKELSGKVSDFFTSIFFLFKGVHDYKKDTIYKEKVPVTLD